MKTKMIGLLFTILLPGMLTLSAATPDDASYKADTLYVGNDTVDIVDTTQLVNPFIHTAAQFPGGDAALHNYIQANLSYPLIAKQQGIEGRIVASIQIDETGKVTSIQILNDIGGGCAGEVERLLSSMPVWIPQWENGRYTASQTLFTFTFKL